MSEEQRQHLEFIQNTITRMNTNSFQLKGMAITIVAALLAVYGSNPKVLFVFIGVIPCTVFWFLDAYYLQLERKFRGVYKGASGLDKDNTIVLYDMPINDYTDGDYSYCNSFWSKSVVWTYLPMILILIGAGVCIIKFPQIALLGQ